MERKFGKYAVKNLSSFIVFCFAASYLLWLFLPEVYEMLIFDTVYVFSGHQYWRLFTWIFTMPGPVGVFTVLMLFVYYNLGNRIENSIGTFLYNIYIFGALFLLTVAQFTAGLIEYLEMPEVYDAVYKGMESAGTVLYGQDTLEVLSYWSPTYFLSIGVFLGYAFNYSNAMMLFMFMIPVKASWIAGVDLIVMAYYFIRYEDIMLRAIILAVVLNFGILYLIVKKYGRNRRFTASAAQLKRRREFKAKMQEATRESTLPEGITRHKCAICGRTEKDNDELEFRFCSKCNGNYEYCNEHLFTHQHKK